ncbi:hypothetical protein SAMN04488543_4019 [Friedmanniella luteola]|uniref:Uncharacterized protein n=1 Tax=Friedmanniella luteola TaxID=546871 RepID=A0A1H1ZV13_9ACTN|nr:hypothetical protein [Friedmanniella luteola]SDT37417.1 hypothetical protein SAMN04488543_4019 [Friedmanniella luteola]
MTTSTAHLLRTITVTTAPDLVRFWTALMGDGGIGRRTLWLVFLDEDGRPAPAVVPVDDIPLDPRPADVDSFRLFFDHLDGYGTPVLLLSRPGPSAVQDHDRRWGRALASCTPRWPVHLATEGPHGHCVVTPLPHPSGEP